MKLDIGYWIFNTGKSCPLLAKPEFAEIWLNQQHSVLGQTYGTNFNPCLGGTNTCIVSVSNNIFTCGNEPKNVYLLKQKPKIFLFLFSQTKSKILFCSGKLKHFLLLGNTITDIFSLAETNKMIFSCLGKQKHIFFFLVNK